LSWEFRKVTKGMQIKHKGEERENLIDIYQSSKESGILSFCDNKNMKIYSYNKALRGDSSLKLN
jgi:hypothetical protein